MQTENGMHLVNQHNIPHLVWYASDSFNSV